MRAIYLAGNVYGECRREERVDSSSCEGPKTLRPSQDSSGLHFFFLFQIRAQLPPSYLLSKFLLPLMQPTLIVWGEEDQVFPLELGYRLKRSNTQVLIHNYFLYRASS